MDHHGDRDFLELLRRRGSMTISEIEAITGVTATAVRNRLNRLMDQGLVDREELRVGRGRPRHRYSATERALSGIGQNYDDLAVALWQEIKNLKNQPVRLELVRRVCENLARKYRGQVTGVELSDRLAQLRDLLSERGIDVEVDAGDTGQEGAPGVPVLRQHSCPYHELAQTDRVICSLERKMLEKILDSKLHLSHCRLDGHGSCEFTPQFVPLRLAVGAEG